VSVFIFGSNNSQHGLTLYERHSFSTSKHCWILFASMVAGVWTEVGFSILKKYGTLSRIQKLWNRRGAILKLLTREFSALLDECPSLVDVVCLLKDLKRWCLSTVTKILNIDYFCLTNIFCCSGVIDGKEEGRFDSPGQLNVTPSTLSLYFGFSILLIGF